MKNTIVEICKFSNGEEIIVHNSDDDHCKRFMGR